MEIGPLPESLVPAALELWRDAGLTRPWNDPADDLRRALDGASSTVLAGVAGGELAATAMIGDDGHRAWLYYLAVRADLRGRGLGRTMMGACERWCVQRAIPKLNLMVREDNAQARGFYAALDYGTDDVVVMTRRFV